MALIWLAVWPPRRTRPPRSQVHRILVVRVDPRVGNVLLTTPLLRALHRGSGSGPIAVDVLVARGKETILQGLDFVDRIIAFDKRDAFLRPWRIWALTRALRSTAYDVAIDASHFHAFSFTSAWLTRTAHAGYSISHDRGPARRFVDEAIPHEPAHINEVEAKLELLRPLEIEPCGAELATCLGREGPRVERLLTSQLPTGRFVALNIGARKADHRWAPERFAELAVRIQGLGLIPLVMWGPGELELAKQIVELSQGVARLGPPTDLEGLAATFRVASAVVANDTGPLHLACAVGAPTVGCFLADDWARWAHPGPKFIAVPLRRESDPVGAVERGVRTLVGGRSGEAHLDSPGS